MAEKSRIQIRNVTNNGASATSLVELPLIKGRYHSISIGHGYASGTNTVAAALTNISLIRLLANGRVQRQFTGTELFDLNTLNGLGYGPVTGVLPNSGSTNGYKGVISTIYFGEPWRKDARDQDALALSTTGFESLALEITLGAASTPKLDVFAVVDNVLTAKAMPFCKVVRQTLGASGTSWDWPSMDKKDLLTQVSFYADLTKVTARKDNVIIHENPLEVNDTLLTQSGMTPNASGRTANLYDVVFDHDDLLGSAINLDPVRDFNFTLEGASLGSTVALVQRIGMAD
jgi:hypothetical protein